MIKSASPDKMEASGTVNQVIHLWRTVVWEPGGRHARRSRGAGRDELPGAGRMRLCRCWPRCVVRPRRPAAAAGEGIGLPAAGRCRRATQLGWQHVEQQVEALLPGEPRHDPDEQPPARPRPCPCLTICPKRIWTCVSPASAARRSARKRP